MERNEFRQRLDEAIKTDPELKDAENARLREWRETHRESERARSKAKYQRDKEYYNKKSRAWYAANKDRYKEYAAQRKEKRAANPEPDRIRVREWHHRNADKRREYERRRREGPNREQRIKLLRYAQHKHYLSREQYEEIYPRLAEGPCEICGVKAKMKIDHCHKKNVFRGVICDGCNRGLGFFKENPFALMAAVKYLERLR